MVVETSVEIKIPSKAKTSLMDYARKQGTNLGHSLDKEIGRPELVLTMLG